MQDQCNLLQQNINKLSQEIKDKNNAMEKCEFHLKLEKDEKQKLEETLTLKASDFEMATTRRVETEKRLAEFLTDQRMQ